MSELYNFTVNDIHGHPIQLTAYQAKVLLIVNVASQCTFTKQYQALEQLYQEFKAQDFIVLGFPCNQFAQQEPGTSKQIAAFCTTHYHISFPLFSKLEVNGPNAHPLFKFLKEQAPGLLGSSAIKWNFTKFLIDSQGQVSKRYAPFTKPETIRSAIVELLYSSNKK